MKLFLIIFLILFAVYTPSAHARIGVGVGSGKIVIDEILKPGTIYQLPAFSVLNTGDEPSGYKVSITYHTDQSEEKPSENWFIFSPQKFDLEPTKVQIIGMKLNLPVNARPGKYFAYIEASPLKKSESGITTVGIAAASRLYFTVVPANFFQGIFYKVLSFWRVYDPWPKRVIVTLSIISIILLFKKFFNVQIDFKKKEPEQKEKDTEKKE